MLSSENVCYITIVYDVNLKYKKHSNENKFPNATQREDLGDAMAG